MKETSFIASPLQYLEMYIHSSSLVRKLNVWFSRKELFYDKLLHIHSNFFSLLIKKQWKWRREKHSRSRARTNNNSDGSSNSIRPPHKPVNAKKKKWQTGRWKIVEVIGSRWNNQCKGTLSAFASSVGIEAADNLLFVFIKSKKKREIILCHPLQLRFSTFCSLSRGEFKTKRPYRESIKWLGKHRQAIKKNHIVVCIFPHLNSHPCFLEDCVSQQ